MALDGRHRRPADAAAVAWAFPLLSSSLARSTPAAPGPLALATVQLAERRGGGGALDLARAAAKRQPACQLLAQKLAQLQKAAAASGIASCFTPLLPGDSK